MPGQNVKRKLLYEQWNSKQCFFIAYNRATLQNYGGKNLLFKTYQSNKICYMNVLLKRNKGINLFQGEMISTGSN